MVQVPTWQEALGVVTSAFGIYVALLVWSRVVGPRSFSQMTAFDIGVTVAIGAVVGGTATGVTPLWGGVLGLSMLFAIRAVVSRLRRHGLDRLVDNRPILVMSQGQIHPDRLLAAKITRADVLEALRSAGITRFAQVLAVIVERNGEMSVLQHDDDFDTELFAAVRGHELLPRA